MSGISRLFANRTVRKNVNLDADMAERLERLSAVSGLAQGELLGIAMRQDFMRRLTWFVSDDIASPVAEVIDEYQSRGPGRMTGDMSSRLLRILSERILPKSLFPYRADDPEAPDVVSLNEYMASHIRDEDADAFLPLAECRGLARNGEFFTYDLDAACANVGRYVRFMATHADSPLVYQGDFLFRNLVVIFRDFCPGMAFGTKAEARAYQYRACAEFLGELFPTGGPGA